MKKDKLYLFTFLSLLAIVFVTAYFSMNYLVGLSTEQFLKIQLESSKREAQELAKMINYQIENNVDKETIIENFQSSIENTNMQSGFVCMFDWSGKEICHPNPDKIGKITGPDESYVMGIEEEVDSKDFYSYLKDKEKGGGVRDFNDPNRESEIIYLFPVNNTDWIVAAHANMDKINEEVKSVKTNFLMVHVITGLIIVFLSVLMVRFIGSNYERALEQKNETLSKEVLSLSKLNHDLATYKKKMDGSDQNGRETYGTESKKRILTYLKNELVSLGMEDIAYIYTENTVTYVKRLDGKVTTSNNSLEELLNDLDDSVFFRANRQFILSINAIHKILRYGNNQLKIEVVPESNINIIVSKNKASEFKKWLNS
ncbi:LytTR family transcriptional regulator DNA-binding domain-containing protein [Muricauda sp. 334s03]|uniref:LytTR family transcriptional regulator DNA-binding domain-containing protein n=1 Tax=Flagellimonas yonaguniensis TaxID=3031325 RepID=A0ABT5Y4G2_9FLAO|nr:LytTR family transcriptional regulator DNA-binding domain-containing protein [[Muricauda] yonaguniensis]MDF0718339.1 LytTR family transcriptional regulator DNA-binding domain-containing protein [[Muricauda] yonaguniensis]